MHVRRTLAAIAAGATMLLGAGTASAAEPVRIVGTLGRNAPVYTSYPNDRTPTSKWISSAQGEVVGTPTKGEPRGLRGRGAVQETFGVRRARIYDVKLQQLRGGVWTTVTQNLTDVVNEASRAYAISVTPERRYCSFEWLVPKRTYRVVQTHGVRRVDGVVANRTTTSKSFQASALDDDPECPPGAFNAHFGGPNEGVVNDQMTVGFESNWVSLGQPVRGVVVGINFEDGLTVEPVELDGLQPNLDTDDENDYVGSFAEWPATIGIENALEATWNATAAQVGTYTAVATVSSSKTPKVHPASDTWSVTVAEAEEPPEADLSAVVNMFTDDDVDPSTSGIQVHPGDRVHYRVSVENAGPADVDELALQHHWTPSLGVASSGWSTSSPFGLQPTSNELNADGDLEQTYENVTPDSVVQIDVWLQTDGSAPVGEKSIDVDTFFTCCVAYDDPNENNHDAHTFEVVPPTEEVTP
jgi:hypothetical protein